MIDTGKQWYVLADVNYEYEITLASFDTIDEVIAFLEVVCETGELPIDALTVYDAIKSGSRIDAIDFYTPRGSSN